MMVRPLPGNANHRDTDWEDHDTAATRKCNHEVVMKRGSPRTMKTSLPTRCRGGPAGPPRADAWVGPYLSFSEQTRRHQEGTKKRSPWSPFRDCSGYTEGMTLGAAVVL